VRNTGYSSTHIHYLYSSSTKSVNPRSSAESVWFLLRVAISTRDAWASRGKALCQYRQPKQVRSRMSRFRSLDMQRTYPFCTASWWPAPKARPFISVMKIVDEMPFSRLPMPKYCCDSVLFSAVDGGCTAVSSMCPRKYRSWRCQISRLFWGVGG
jgi:hypothetical protein